MNLTKILTIVLFAASLFLAYRLYRSVQGTIEEREAITTSETAIIEKLKLIREAQIVYQSVNGKYTSNWDSLTRFIESGRVPIIQRREKITQLAYGQEEVEIIVDTLGFTPAKERIFKKNYTVGASDNGIFMGYRVKVGDQVLKNQKAYAIKVGDKINEPPFLDQGTIDKLEPIKNGTEVIKGQLLISLSEYAFDPNTNLTTLGDLPGDSGLKFEIFVGVVDRNGLKVQVIEVKDPNPVNPSRKESNEAKNRKPLHFGSRLDVSTSGNWE